MAKLLLLVALVAYVLIFVSATDPPISCNGDPNAMPGCGTNCGRLCSNYKQKNVVCTLECRSDGCDCKKGFVLVTNTGRCVKPEDCPATSCKGDPNAIPGCGINCNRRCSDVNNTEPVSCIDVCYVDGCDCKPGYWLDTNTGLCVTKEQCTTSCKGDPNAFPGCGVNCGRHCSDVNRTEGVSCAAVCYDDGCDCKPGYWLDTNTGLCVTKEQCTPTCGTYEVYNPKKGCVCEKNYVRSPKGNCIPTTSCKGDPNAIPGCGINCNRRCSDVYNTEPVACITVCYDDGCDCKPGYWLDTNTGLCVTKEQCTPTCGTYEVYNPKKGCVCEKNYVRSPKGNCIPTPECGPHEVYNSKDGCVCKSKYTRNRDKVCVPIITCNKKNQAYEPCPYPCPYRTCGIDDRLIRCAAPSTCPPPACRCRDGFFKNDKGECVRWEECPPKCGDNEVFSTCIQAVCRALNCTQRGQSLPCPDVPNCSCQKGCICEEGYLRDTSGNCVPEEQCNGCPEGEVFNTCPPAKCDAEYCPKTRNSRLACISTKNCHTPRCTCKYGYHRDRYTGRCIPTQDCPPFKCDGPNEEFNSCPSGCPNGSCQQYLHPTPCPVYIIAPPCVPQCRCRKGYFRNAKGLCVKSCECRDEDQDSQSS